MRIDVLNQIKSLISVQDDNPELLKAQFAALSRLVPLLYFILVANAWVLAIAYFGKAPNWLSIYVALFLSALCAIRLLKWWHRRGAVFTVERATAELNRTNKLSAVLGVAFSAWAISLYPYGDAYQKAQVATFMTMTMLCCMLCLIHLRSAALIIAFTVSIPCALFFASTGVPTFVGTAIDITLVTGAVVIVILIQYRDFTRMIRARQKTQELSNENLRLANLDSLTDLPNRRAFFAHLDEAFLTARGRGCRLALGIIDLDGFKPVNDLYGHAAGDRLLVEVATRLSTVCRAEKAFLARLGGDEFAYVVMDAGDDAVLITQGEEISSILRSTFQLPQANVQITGSVGIAVYPEMASSFQQLFERADYALYHGKSSRRGSAILFSSEHEAQISWEARIEQALKTADLERELSVVFQPIVEIHSQTTVGFEALARWESPTLGQVSPGYFIPVAERAGIVGSLTRPLLKKALAVAEQWSSDVRLSFNLSAHDLNAAEGVLSIVGIIESSNFDAKKLDLEITETAFTHDFAQVQSSIEMLRRLGCGISLDDFGTGYSSLSRLHALPLTKIKIDRSFVTGLNESASSLKIVKSLLALSRDMGLECVIEGVETEEEMSILRELGGLMVQGYFYSPPIVGEKVLAYLHQSGTASGMRAGKVDGRLRVSWK